jgi:voltage-gated potassium channel
MSGVTIEGTERTSTRIRVTLLDVDWPADHEGFTMAKSEPTLHLESKVTFFQFVILVLSIVVLGALLVDTFFRLPQQASRLLDLFDTVVCGLFLIDFSMRFRRAESKLMFMKWGWIDLLASIPNLEVLRWGRTIRILRIIRLLRGIRSFQRLLSIIFREKIKSGLGSVFVTTFLMIFFSSTAILLCERDPEATIKTAEDAVWWSVTTITTVGYGDKYPLTTEGRIIAMMLMVSGVGLFGTLSGLIASYFLGQQEQHEADHRLSLEMEALNRKLDDLNRKLDDSNARPNVFE